MGWLGLSMALDCSWALYGWVWSRRAPRPPPPAPSQSFSLAALVGGVGVQHLERRAWSGGGQFSVQENALTIAGHLLT